MGEILYQIGHGTYPRGNIALMVPVERDPSKGLNAAVAAQLRAERAAADLTVEQLAREADMSPVSVQRYLRGKRHIDVAVLFQLAKALEVEPAEIVANAQRRADIFWSSTMIEVGDAALSEPTDTSPDLIAADEQGQSISGEQEQSEETP